MAHSLRQVYMYTPVDKHTFGEPSIISYKYHKSIISI